MPKHKIICDDNRIALKKIADKSVDLIATDPPYALVSGSYKGEGKHSGGFMNKKWDAALPSVAVWRECLRVLKPGAFMFCMSAPRQDVLSRMIVNIEDAGFNVAFPSIYHAFASGFPKAANISKLANKQGHTSKAKALEGTYAGYAPKPCLEVVIVAMKPLEHSTYVAQALDNFHGCTHLDAGRIPSDGTIKTIQGGKNINSGNYGNTEGNNEDRGNTPFENTKGRFSPHLLVEDDVFSCVRDKGTKPHLVTSNVDKYEGWGSITKCNKAVVNYGDFGSFSRYFSLDAWWDARIAELPEEVQKTFPFMIVPKAAKSEKNAGVNFNPIDNADWYNGKFPCSKANKNTTNKHPTCKPIKLISYLITIATRKGDIVLDPYVGSGTTLVAAEMLKRDSIGVEISAEYCEIGFARLEEATVQTQLGREKSTIERVGF